MPELFDEKEMDNLLSNIPQTNFLIPKGKDHKIIANVFTRKDYTFIGWNTKADGKGTEDQPDTEIKNVQADTTLYAQWKRTSEIKVLSVKMPQKKLYIKKGKKVKVPAIAYTAKGEKVTLKWKSKKTSIVKVTQKGVVTGVKPGKPTVTVTALGKKATLTVFVLKKAIKVKNVTIAKKTKQALKVKKSKFLTAVIKPKNATGKTGAVYKWKSGNKKIAKIDAVGKITALKKGNCKITVTVGGKKKTFTLKIKK